jgi:AcrR family transcriptional regulator
MLMANDSTALKLVRTIFRLEITRGHLKWSVAEVARSNRTSRATLYYYFGKSKKEILNNALTAICEEYFGLTAEREELAQKDFLASARITRSLVLQTPEFAVFYQLWRARPSELKDVLKGFEEKYQSKLAKMFPKSTKDQIIFAHSCLHGIMTAPFLSPAEFDQSLRILIQRMRS